MNPYAGIIAAVVIVVTVGSAYTKGYSDGAANTAARSAVKIDNQRAEVERKNITIVKGDQALIVAKTQDKEKIVTIYRTIREQLDAQIIEVPVYRNVSCNVPADGMRLIAQAAAGGLPADPAGAARGSAAETTGTKR